MQKASKGGKSILHHAAEGKRSQSSEVVMEVCVDSVPAVKCAEASGAGRVELCSNLDVGGLTPSVGMMSFCKRSLGIPVFAMIRPRCGDFCYSNDEFDVMKCDIATAKQQRVDGIVLGVSLPDGSLDAGRLAHLVELARPLPVTVHRAFDLVPDPGKALDQCIAIGVKRILTSGGQASALEGAQAIEALVTRAQGRVCIVPGGGITASNIATILCTTGATEFHLSGRPKGYVPHRDSGRSTQLVIRNCLRLGFGDGSIGLPCKDVLEQVRDAATTALVAQLRSKEAQMASEFHPQFVQVGNARRPVGNLNIMEATALSAVIHECGKDIVLAVELARMLFFDFDAWRQKIPFQLMPKPSNIASEVGVVEAFYEAMYSRTGCCAGVLLLDSCSICDAHMLWICEGLGPFPSLRVVDLSFNEGLSHKGISMLCDVLQNGSVEELYLTGIGLGSEAVPSLVRFIECNPSVRVLSVAENKLSHQAAVAIVAAAVAHRSMKMLCLRGNGIVQTDNRLKRLLSESTTLRVEM